MQVTKEDQGILTFVNPEIKLISPTRVLNLKDINLDEKDLPKGTKKRFVQEVISPVMLSTGNNIRQRIRDYLDRVAILTDKGYLLSPNTTLDVQEKFDKELIRFEEWITRIETQYPAKREEFLRDISMDPALQNIQMKKEFLEAVNLKTPSLEKVLEGLNFDYSMYSIPATTGDRKGRKNPLDTAINRLIDEITSGCKSAFDLLETMDRAPRGTVEKVANLSRKADSFSFLSTEMRVLSEGLMSNIQFFLIGHDLKGQQFATFREMTRYLGNREHFLGCYQNKTQLVPDFVFANNHNSIGQSLFESTKTPEEEPKEDNASTSDINDLFGGSIQLPPELYDSESNTPEDPKLLNLEEVEDALLTAAEKSKSKDLGNSVLHSLQEELQAEAESEVGTKSTEPSSDFIKSTEIEVNDLDSISDESIDNTVDENVISDDDEFERIESEEKVGIVDFDEMPDYDSFDDFSDDDFEGSFFS